MLDTLTMQLRISAYSLNYEPSLNYVKVWLKVRLTGGFIVLLYFLLLRISVGNVIFLDHLDFYLDKSRSLVIA